MNNLCDCRQLVCCRRWLQALVGTTLHIPTLAGRTVTLPLTDVIKPNSTKRIQGEGLPYPKQPSQRGDLIVEFDIQFPDHLLNKTKQIISDALP